MKFLKDLLEVNEMAKAKSAASVLESRYEVIKNILGNRVSLNEGFMDSHDGELEKDMDEAARRFAVIRHAMTLVNKLPEGESKTKNKSRIFGHLNATRNILNKLIKRLNLNDDERQLVRDAGRDRAARERSFR